VHLRQQNLFKASNMLLRNMQKLLHKPNCDEVGWLIGMGWTNTERINQCCNCLMAINVRSFSHSQEIKGQKRKAIVIPEVQLPFLWAWHENT
jgi:hypothetical protein